MDNNERKKRVKWLNDNYSIIVRALRRSANGCKDKGIKSIYEDVLKTIPEKELKLRTRGIPATATPIL